MESAGLRRRSAGPKGNKSESIEDFANSASDESDEPPRYTIDLSLPPRKRYQHVAMDFKAQIATLPVLFDEVVRDLRIKVSVERVRWLARLLLRRVYSKEESEELRGIHETTGIEMYLLVAFNVLLDLFMGCTSGAVKVRDGDKKTKMLHFRSLDWGMNALRKVIVHLDFVEKPGGEVIASSITYIGYVGVLTGVRKGLSVSLLKRDLPKVTTTAAYLIFSDGDEAITLEKDRHSALVRSAADFIVATNHDVAEETKTRSFKATHEDSSFKTLLDGIVVGSISRRAAVVKLWEKSLKDTRRNPSRNARMHDKGLNEENVIGWMNADPILNEETHFATVMDPKEGKVVWTKRYLKPFE